MKWQVPEVIPRTVTIRATAMCLACNPVGENGPNEGVRVRVCSIDDPECSAPLQTEQKTDSNGKVVLDVSTALYPHPLSVFLEFHKEGWLDALLLLNTPPLSYDFDVGEVDMHRQEDVDRIAAGLMTQYDPDKAMVVMSVSNCNLGPGTGIDLGWNDPGQAVIRPSASSSGWPVFAVNLPIGNGLARVVARRTPPDPAQDGATAPIVAVVNLVVRKGAITLAPFVTPTPSPVTPTP